MLNRRPPAAPQRDQPQRGRTQSLACEIWWVGCGTTAAPEFAEYSVGVVEEFGSNDAEVQLRGRRLREASRDRVLNYNRDRKWSLAVRQGLEETGVRVVQTTFQAPNTDGYAECFVRSSKHECLN